VLYYSSTKEDSFVIDEELRSGEEAGEDGRLAL